MSIRQSIQSRPPRSRAAKPALGPSAHLFAADQSDALRAPRGPVVHAIPLRAGRLARVDVVATGGTIASVADGVDQGVAPVLHIKDLVGSVPELAATADVRSTQFMQRASPSITFDDVLRLRDEISRRVADGSSGIVVTQGTDTIEETAFALDLLWAYDEPIAFTGAMRASSLPGPDGPANLLAAVRVAANADARGLGALVVFDDEIHAARFVAKTHTSRLSAFRSRGVGPLGWLTEGRPVIAARPTGRLHLDVCGDPRIPPVALVRLALADDGRVLPALASLGFAGAVIEGFGGGHVTPPMVPLLGRLATEMPVVLASRTGSGEVLTSTYRYPGSELELLEIGLIPAGPLDGLKARVLLSLCLAARLSRDEIAETFAGFAVAAGPARRSPDLSVAASGS